MRKIRVLVVDDSALMRKIISDMINEESDMEAMGTAKNGEDLLLKLTKETPDVITLDVEMPKMDGIASLKELKKRNINIPVIVLSSITSKGAQLTMDCLAAGAFDFLPKPSGVISLDINKIKGYLIDKIRVASLKTAKETIREEQVSQTKVPTSKPVRKTYAGKIEAVTIGASTGGPKALYSVITQLPEGLGVPVFVVQHMPVGFTKAFADRLNNNSKLRVVEATDGEPIQMDTVYVAPGGFHMEVKNDRKIHLNTEPAIWGVRPAVDKLFSAVSQVYGAGVVSAVLTGMGKDGAQGTIEIKKNGGVTLSEDKSTCTIYGMPKAAYETGMVDTVLPINEIASEIVKIVKSGNGR